MEGPSTLPWQRLTSDQPPGCVRAHRVEEGNPGKCAKMGLNARGDGLPGCNLTGIQQEFSCFVPDTQNDWCTVTFDARYPAGAAGEVPEVELWNSLGARTGEIPVNPGWQTYTLSIPICSMACRISFAIETPGPGSTSTLWIDNVSNRCTLTDETSNTLTVGPHPLLPIASAGLDDLATVPAMNDWGVAALSTLFITLLWFVQRRRVR